MLPMWMAGLTDEGHERRQQQQQAAMGLNVAELRTELREIREQIRKLALMNQALWELLRDPSSLPTTTSPESRRKSICATASQTAK